MRLTTFAGLVARCPAALAVGAAVLTLLTGSAKAQNVEPIYDNTVQRQVVTNRPDFGIITRTDQNGQTYSAFQNGFSKALADNSRLTAYVADDLFFDPVRVGSSINSYSFVIANTGSASATFRPVVRFWDDYGIPFTQNGVIVSSRPGQLFYNADFGPITLSSGEVRTITVTGTGLGGDFEDSRLGALSLPTYEPPPGRSGSNQRIWTGLAFLSTTADGTSQGALESIGQVLYSPTPAVGTSADVVYTTDPLNPARAAFYDQRFINGANEDPAGYLYNAPGIFYANLGWSINGIAVLPEPSPLPLVAFGALPPVAVALVARRRRRRQK